MNNSTNCFELLKAGDADGLRKMLESDPVIADAIDSNGVSLLMHSVYHGREDLAQLIAGKKKALDIFEAASLGRLERLKQCIDEDSSAIKSHSEDGFTALHLACFFSQSGAVRLLIESGAAVGDVATNAMRVMPLHSAAAARNLEAALLLLEHGAAVNAKQHGGWAAIHAAAQNGDRSMAELLLKHHADPTLTNDEGKTPATVAREKGHADLAAMFENRSG